MLVKALFPQETYILVHFWFEFLVVDLLLGLLMKLLCESVSSFVCLCCRNFHGSRNKGLTLGAIIFGWGTLHGVHIKICRGSLIGLFY